MAMKLNPIIALDCSQVKRAILYLRVSTDEQADKGYSLSTQLEACERYAHDHGFEIVGIYKDDYTGAVPLETRPEGRKAYDMLRSGAADALIAYRIDRIVRPPEEGDEWDMPILIRGLAKLGRDIHTVNRGQLKTDFASLLIAMLDAKGAGDERRAIIERTSRGRNAKAREGKVVGNGRPLYGYTYAGGALTVVESEAKIIRSIFEWYAEKGMGDLTIARELSMLGIKSPGQAKGTGPKIQSGLWRHTAVRAVLLNEAYCGVYHYGKIIGASGKGGVRPEDQHIKIDVPPIVSREIWQAAQARRDYNKRMAARNTRHEYLLRGMVKCGCGHAMTAHIGRRGKTFYSCCTRSYRHKGLEVTCGEKCAKGAAVESLAWSYAVKIITERDTLLPRLREAQAEARKENQPMYEKLTAIEDDLTECEAEAGQIAAAMGAIPQDKQETSIVFKSLQRKAAELDERYKTQARKRDALKARIVSIEVDDESIYNLAIYATDAAHGIDHATFEEKRRWLEYLAIGVEVKDGKATASSKLKIEPVTIDLGILASTEGMISR